MVFWILGGTVDGVDVDAMLRFWITLGKVIKEMYIEIDWGRKGVGRLILGHVFFPLVVLLVEPGSFL